MINLYVLHQCPEIAAGLHRVTDIATQPRQTVQILSSALFLLSPELFDDAKAWFMPPDYAAHPLARWASERQQNFDWLVEFAYALLAEYRQQHGRKHHCRNFLTAIARHSVDFEEFFRPLEGFTSFMPLTPEDSWVYAAKADPNSMFTHTFLDTDGNVTNLDVVATYQRYYMLHKITSIHRSNKCATPQSLNF